MGRWMSYFASRHDGVAFMALGMMIHIDITSFYLALTLKYQDGERLKEVEKWRACLR